MDPPDTKIVSDPRQKKYPTIIFLDLAPKEIVCPPLNKKKVF